MKNALRFLDHHFEEVLCVLGFAFFIVISNIQVFTRVIPGVPVFPWTEELSRYTFIWIMFLGTSWAVRTNAHLRVTLVTGSLPKIPKNILNIFAHAVIVAYSIYLFSFAIHILQRQMQTGQHLTATGLPTWIISLCFPVMLVLTTLRSVQRCYLDLRGTDITLTEEEQAIADAEAEALAKAAKLKEGEEA